MKMKTKLAAMLLLASFAALGCSRGLPVEQGAIVKGKVVKGGQPLSAGGGDLPPGMEQSLGFEVALVPHGDKNAGETHIRGMYYGEYRPEDGGVVFVGPGKGIPAGSYTLVVRGQEAMPGDVEGDPFGGKFTAESSPIRIDVPPSAIGGEHDFGEIDLDNPPQQG